MPVETKHPGQVVFILWLSMLIAQLGVFAVGQFFPPADSSQSPDDLEVMAMAFTGLGLATTLASARAVPILFRSQNYQTMMLLRFALAESATIFGFILAMLGADMQWVYILTGLGLVAHIIAFPTNRDREAHAKLGSAPK
jgi:F0F1-type ATP synthase membrane subunit c/vacuolar-type H+-ATPase subunit K